MTYQQPYYPPPPQKRSSATWWIIGGCGAILILAALCACGFFVLGGAALLSVEPSAPAISRVTPAPASRQPTIAAPTSYKVGETIKLRDAILTVTGVEFSQGTDFDKPDAGKAYLLVHIHMENAGSREISVNPFHFKVIDSNGVIVEQTVTTVVEDSLNAVELARG